MRTFEDYCWLTGDEGRNWLRRVAEDPRLLVRQAAALRKELSAERTHLVLQQVELRRRARAKFSEADRMFFTPLRLEQASDGTTASYKAGRFPAKVPLADLCCGIGGDLVALARRGSVLGVDRDPVTALMASANLAELNPLDGQSAERVLAADVGVIGIGDYAAWHIDPDRRAEGRRTTRVEFHEPGPATIDQLLGGAPAAAVKLAPAAALPEEWVRRAELEWISRGRECRQLVAWFGSLAERPGSRRATVLAEESPGRLQGVRTIFGQASEAVPVAPRVGRYVFDPDPAVIAARLVAALAEQHGMAAADPGSLYLTGDRPVAEPALACFEVTDVVPFDRKRLRQLLASRGIGRLEIKKRAVPVDPEQLRRGLRLRGDQAGVLLLTPIGAKVLAILARRV
ncbi:MAG: SAM-dependent methyltransferase [Pirellulales bacterium]|nr:SAM-dependent methyltransferase [Pirellulales bacterium]